MQVTRTTVKCRDHAAQREAARTAKAQADRGGWVQTEIHLELDTGAIELHVFAIETNPPSKDLVRVKRFIL